jgi:hypothetical protein
MPAGAGPGGAFLFSMVGRNAADAIASSARGLDAVSGRLDSLATGLERIVQAATTAATARIPTASHDHGLPCGGTSLIGVGRRFFFTFSPSLDIRPLHRHILVRKTADAGHSFRRYAMHQQAPPNESKAAPA